MKAVRFLAALIVFCVCFLVVLVGMTLLSREYATIWLPFALCGVVAALMSFASPSPSRTLVWIGVASGVILLWMVSEPQVSLRSRPEMASAAIAFVGSNATCALCLISRWVSTRMSAFGWGLFLVLISWLVAFFSSPSGGSGGMISAAIDLLGLSPSQAELFVLVLRKCGHFMFYGLLGWTAFRWCYSTSADPRRSMLFGLSMALAFAMFDEGRQTFYPDRTGSGWDVLLDCAGAVAFVWLASSKARSYRPSSEASK